MGTVISDEVKEPETKPEPRIDWRRELAWVLTFCVLVGTGLGVLMLVVIGMAHAARGW